MDVIPAATQGLRPLIQPNPDDGRIMNSMRTTFKIHESVLQRLREEALRGRKTMSELAEGAIRNLLCDLERARNENREMPPLPSWNSGGANVDISNRDDLYDAMEGR